MITFTKTGANQQLTMDNIRNKNINWGRSALRLHYNTEFGYIETSAGTRVDAYRPLSNTLRVELYNLVTGVTIIKPQSFFNQFSFDISYNCFGFCFAESKVWILDPTQFILDDYEEVDSENAEIILFKEYVGFNDVGDEKFIYSHAVKVLDNGNVSFKPGLNRLVENVERNKAIHTYNFNHEIYLKKK